MMKKLMIIITLILAGVLFSSCEKEEKICDCFAKQGITNKEALIGKWEFESFGYTVNGDKIKEKEKIERGGITFSDLGEFIISYWNTGQGTYTISNTNEIILNGNFQTFMLPPGKEEQDKEDNIAKSISNSICYKISNDKLYIHTKKLKGNNVLILKKRSQL